MAQVLLFGRLADLAGERKHAVNLGAERISVDALVDRVATGDAALAAALRGTAVRVAVNGEIGGEIGMLTTVEDDDEVAFLPPVSGG